MGPVAVQPFYADWTFWAFLTSAMAVVLSQLPPIKFWLRRPRVIIELDRRFNISHKVGFSNAGGYVSLQNTGGRDLRVKRLTFEISREGGPPTTLTARDYFPNLDSPKSVLLAPFTIKPGAEWGHKVQAYKLLTAQEDRALAAAMAAVETQIHERRLAQKAAREELVAADQITLTGVMQLFHQEYNWFPGEYQVCVRAETAPPTLAEARYRFTVYETLSSVMIASAYQYKYGFWESHVHWADLRPT